MQIFYFTEQILYKGLDSKDFLLFELICHYFELHPKIKAIIIIQQRQTV